MKQARFIKREMNSKKWGSKIKLKVKIFPWTQFFNGNRV